jgi:hypothetical protein
LPNTPNAAPVLFSHDTFDARTARTARTGLPGVVSERHVGDAIVHRAGEGRGSEAVNVACQEIFVAVFAVRPIPAVKIR